MISLIRKNGRGCPVVFCDHCGEIIEDARIGMVLYDRRFDAEGDQTQPIFLHKGKCDAAVKEKHQMSGWAELQTFLMDLTHNIGITPRKLSEHLGEDILP